MMLLEIVVQEQQIMNFQISFEIKLLLGLANLQILLLAQYHHLMEKLEV